MKECIRETIQQHQFPTVELVRRLLTEKYKQVPYRIDQLGQLEKFLQTTNLIIDCYLAVHKVCGMSSVQAYCTKGS